MNFYKESSLEPDIDYAYDSMRDAFLLCETEEDAKQLIKTYSLNLCDSYLPEKFKYLMEESDG